MSNVTIKKYNCTAEVSPKATIRQVITTDDGKVIERVVQRRGRK